MWLLWLLHLSSSFAAHESARPLPPCHDVRLHCWNHMIHPLHHWAWEQHWIWLWTWEAQCSVMWKDQSGISAICAFYIGALVAMLAGPVVLIKAGSRSLSAGNFSFILPIIIAFFLLLPIFSELGNWNNNETCKWSTLSKSPRIRRTWIQSLRSEKFGRHSQESQVACIWSQSIALPWQLVLTRSRLAVHVKRHQSASLDVAFFFKSTYFFF